MIYESIRQLTLAGTSCQHPARVIRSFGWNKLYWPIYGILGTEDGHWTGCTLKKDFLFNFAKKNQITLHIVRLV